MNPKDKITLENIRLRKGMSQDDLAKALGVSRQTIYNWECGTIPKSNYYEPLCDIFDANSIWAWIFGIDIDFETLESLKSRSTDKENLNDVKNQLLLDIIVSIKKNEEDQRQREKKREIKSIIRRLVLFGICFCVMVFISVFTGMSYFSSIIHSNDVVGVAYSTQPATLLTFIFVVFVTLAFLVYDVILAIEIVMVQKDESFKELLMRQKSEKDIREYK